MLEQRRTSSFLLILLLIVVTHVALLQFVSNVVFEPFRRAEIVPLTLIIEEVPFIPAITAFTASPRTKKTPQKKTIDSAQVEKTEVELSSSGSGVLLSNASPEAAPPRLFTTQTLPPIIQTASDSASALSLRPPPSATYLLDVVRREPKTPNPYLGTGQLIWKQDGKNYSMHMDVGINILFTNIELYRMQSEGTIEGGGIKPCLARETRRGKSTTSTNFNYDSNTINFSSDAKIVSLSEGSQDRITVLMQLASVGNADPAQFQPGKNITIQVAEEKDAPAYQFVITDQETLDTKLGPLETWHIVRPSRPGFYSSRIDIWLAPELNWLPVQIRNTESNGAVTTQTIRKIN